MDCEVLVDAGMALRGAKMLEAMIDTAGEAGVRVTVSENWTGCADVLMSYGLGHMVRRQWQRQHLRRGGRLIGWDLGYWDRDVSGDASMRLTIDDDHPHRWIAPMPAARFDAAGITLREDSDPKGPVVLCGLGRKQRELKGYRGQEWELRQLQVLRARHKQRPVLYRPKRKDQPLPGCKTAEGLIENVIRGASLVVCAHSNVAVDACIAGIPVRCEDGAAFALYRDNPAPSREQRIEFLRSLAWWQWKPSEALQAWKFLRARLCV